MENLRERSEISAEYARRTINRTFPLQVVKKYAREVTYEEQQQRSHVEWGIDIIEGIVHGEIEKTATGIIQAGVRRRTARSRMAEVLRAESRRYEMEFAATIVGLLQPAPNLHQLEVDLYPEMLTFPIEARGADAMFFISQWLDCRKDIDRLKNPSPFGKFLDTFL